MTKKEQLVENEVVKTEEEKVEEQKVITIKLPTKKQVLGGLKNVALAAGGFVAGVGTVMLGMKRNKSEEYDDVIDAEAIVVDEEIYE